MNEDLINEIVDHLLDIRDQLVKISLIAFMIRRIAGAEFVQADGKIVSVDELIRLQYEYMAYVNALIEQLHKILKDYGKCNL